MAHELSWRSRTHVSSRPTDGTDSRFGAEPVGSLAPTDKNKAVRGIFQTLDNGADTIVRSVFDGDGNITLSIAASGNTMTYAYDVFCRLTQSTMPDGSYSTIGLDAEGNQTQLAFTKSPSAQPTFSAATSRSTPSIVSRRPTTRAQTLHLPPGTI